MNSPPPVLPTESPEASRLGALVALQTLDTAPERVFDALVQAAALVCAAPMALLTLMDADRQWFKASVGWPHGAETPRTISFCSQTIAQSDGLLEVPDIWLDARFADSPLVVGDVNIRFYAAAALTLGTGEGQGQGEGQGARIGTLCVLDRRVRQLTPAQREALQLLAYVAAHALESRNAVHALADSRARFRALCDGLPLGVFAADPTGICSYANERWLDLFATTPARSIGQPWTAHVHESDRAAVLADWQEATRSGEEFERQFRVQADAAIRLMHARAAPAFDAQRQPLGYVGSVEDVTARRRAAQQLAAEQARLANLIDAAGMGTWELNLQTGEARYNERWAAMLGYTLDVLTPLARSGWKAHAHPDDVAEAERLGRQHLAGDTPFFECPLRMRHRDGHWVQVLSRGCLLTRTADGKPEWMFGTHVDVTPLRQHQEALVKSEALLNRASEAAGVGVWELDLVSKQVTWSAQTRRIHGVSADYQPVFDEAIGFYAPEARPAVQAAVERALESGQSYDLESPFHQASGERIWVRAIGGVEYGVDGKPARLLGTIQDVTRLHRLRAELAEQHELMRVTLHSIGDAVLTTDGQGSVSWLNPVAERLTGWAVADAIGRPALEVLQIVDVVTRLPVPDPITRCLEQGALTGLAGPVVLLSRTGQQFGIEDSAAPIRSKEGTLLGVVMVFRDVTEQRRMSGEMRWRATHDALTSLVNRAEFETRLRHVLDNSLGEPQGAHSLLFMDLDQFKIVNDACGHSVGDQLLQQVSTLLRATVRASDTLARLGGDEFGVIMRDCAPQQAQRVAQQICERMDDFRFVHEGRRFRIGISIGLVPLDARLGTTALIMQAADSACYAAKEAGRNRVHAWLDTDQAMRARSGEMQWAMRLEQALDEDRFVLFAQRIEPLAAHDPHGPLHFEVLLRLIDDDGALVLPGAFLPAAERFHLATRIDRWVLRHAIGELAALPDLSAINTVSINLSGQSVGDRAFHSHAMAALMQAGPELRRRICLEITETAAVTNVTDAARFIEQVRASGVRVALDDFGAGASSFSYLKTLRVDLLKIDGQYIQNLLDDGLDDAAVRCFVDVARVLGVPTVAEFVDRPDLLERVREIGIDYAQGFLLHCPEPLGNLLAR